MGYVAVAVLIASGLIDNWYLHTLRPTPAGKAVIVFWNFFGMLVLAAANRLWLVPALTGPTRISAGAKSFPQF